jgi:hypothetical protein
MEVHNLHSRWDVILSVQTEAVRILVTSAVSLSPFYLPYMDMIVRDCRNTWKTIVLFCLNVFVCYFWVVLGHNFLWVMFFSITRVISCLLLSSSLRDILSLLHSKSYWITMAHDWAVPRKALSEVQETGWGFSLLKSYGIMTHKCHPSCFMMLDGLQHSVICMYCLWQVICELLIGIGLTARNCG